MHSFRQITVLAASGVLAAGLFLVLPVDARAADLKQLAEQLVNLTPSEARCRNPQTGKEIRVILKGGVLVDGSGKRITDGSRLDCPGIREGGRTVRAGQAAIAIQEEGANVKKEKGVEDVE